MKLVLSLAALGLATGGATAVATQSACTTTNVTAVAPCTATQSSHAGVVSSSNAVTTQAPSIAKVQSSRADGVAKRAAELEALAQGDAAPAPAEPGQQGGALRRTFRFDNGELRALEPSAPKAASGQSSAHCGSTCESKSSCDTACTTSCEAGSSGGGACAPSAPAAPKTKAKVKVRGDVSHVSPDTRATTERELARMRDTLSREVETARRQVEREVASAQERARKALAEAQHAGANAGAIARRSVETARREGEKARRELELAQRRSAQEVRATLERSAAAARDAQNHARAQLNRALETQRKGFRAVVPVAPVPAVPAVPPVPPVPPVAQVAPSAPRVMVLPRASSPDSRSERERTLEARVAELEARLAEMEARGSGSKQPAAPARSQRKGSVQLFFPDSTPAAPCDVASTCDSVAVADDADCSPSRTRVIALGGHAFSFETPADYEELAEAFEDFEDEWSEALEDLDEEWTDALDEIDEEFEDAFEEMEEFEEADEFEALEALESLDRVDTVVTLQPAEMEQLYRRLDSTLSYPNGPLANGWYFAGGAPSSAGVSNAVEPATEVVLRDVVTQMRSEVEDLRATLRDLREQMEARRSSGR